MSESAPTRQECTARDRLPPAIGVDADGLVHRVSAQFATEVLLCDGDGGVVTSHDLHGRDPETWADYVAARRGWRDCWVGERLTPNEIDFRITEVTA